MYWKMKVELLILLLVCGSFEQECLSDRVSHLFLFLLPNVAEDMRDFMSLDYSNNG